MPEKSNLMVMLEIYLIILDILRVLSSSLCNLELAF